MNHPLMQGGLLARQVVSGHPCPVKIDPPQKHHRYRDGERRRRQVVYAL